MHFHQQNLEQHGSIELLTAAKPLNVNRAGKNTHFPRNLEWSCAHIVNVKEVFSDSNNLFLWHKSVRTRTKRKKKKLIFKIPLLSILHLQVRHDYVHSIVPIEHCVELILFDEALCKYFTVPRPLVLPAVAVFRWYKLQIDTWPWSHTWWGHMVLTGPQVCKWVKFYIFRLSYKLTLHDLWPSFVTFDHKNMRFLHYINKPSLVPIRLQLFKLGEFDILSQSYNLTSDDLWPWYMTFDSMDIQRVPYCKPSLVPIKLQFFIWGYFHIFSLSYSLTSGDLWPWHVTFDLINKWGLPYCIYDPTFIEIHQSMWKVEPNVNLFSQQTLTDYRQQGTKRSLCVFPAK